MMADNVEKALPLEEIQFVLDILVTVGFLVVYDTLNGMPIYIRNTPIGEYARATNKIREIKSERNDETSSKILR